MWFELLPSHTTYTLVSYMCLLELILSLWFWDFPSGIWAAPCKTTYIIIRVPVLMFFITRSVFELSLGFVLGFYPFFTGVIWASASTYYIYLGVLDMFIWAQSELGFEPSPLEFELSHAKQNTEPYVCLCWCSSSLHGYLSSFSALSWAFTNVIWAAVFT